MKNASHICTDQTINLEKMGVRLLFGVGERKKNVLSSLAMDGNNARTYTHLKKLIDDF